MPQLLKLTTRINASRAVFVKLAQQIITNLEFFIVVIVQAKCKYEMLQYYTCTKHVAVKLV